MTDLDVAVSLEVKHGKATVQTYPSPSWTVNLRENSAIACAHGGSENQTMNGVSTTLASSVAKAIAFIAKSSPNCMCTVLECDSSHHSSGRKCEC